VSYLEFLKLAAPEAVVVFTALVVLAIGLGSKHAQVICPVLAAFGLIAASVMVTTLPNEASLFGGMLVVSPLTSLLKIICLLLALFTVTLTRAGTFARDYAEYLALLLLATVGLMLLVGSEELLMIFIGLELTGLSLYLMTAFDKRDARSAEAGLKYFLFGSTTSAFTLFGLSFVYGATGSTALAGIGEKLASGAVSPLLAAGMVMTLIGLAFKVAAAPFHLWAPDAYQVAPVPSAAFIASGSKVAAFVVLGKVMLVGFGPAHGSAEWQSLAAGWSPILAALAALSIVVGNLVALAQTNVRRLLAYSAVAHAGYTLLGIIAGPHGFAATLFYTTVYALTLLGAFGVVAWVRSSTGGDDFSHFVGLSSRSPVLAACMAVFILSLAGLPPLAGFFGKFYLFSAALAAGERHGLLWLVVLALLGSLISLYYYLLVLKAIFVDDAPGGASPIVPAPLQRSTLTLLAAAIVIGGILPTNFVAQIIAAVR
jgi:NADH-quinone oxidoreductase subunit N